MHMIYLKKICSIFTYSELIIPKVVLVYENSKGGHIDNSDCQIDIR